MKSALTIALLGLAFGGAVQAAPATEAKKPNPIFAPVEDNPNLPRVLLIGDSISMGYTLPTRKLLAGKANLHRIPVNGGPSSRGITQLDKWLGDGKWDLIQFNFGLHDLRYMPDGTQQVPLAAYEKNLRELVTRLKKTGAVLIWASTTPVPEGEMNPPRLNKDVLAYNAVAKKVMDENGVRINDLYAYALPNLAEWQLPVNVHFKPEGSDKLAERVAAEILKALERE